ncbi:hypothetical protein GCM10028808_73200 [Spirosoma migulaei]
MNKGQKRTWFDPKKKLPNLDCAVEIKGENEVIIACWYDSEEEVFITDEDRLIEDVIFWRFR